MPECEDCKFYLYANEKYSCSMKVCRDKKNFESSILRNFLERMTHNSISKKGKNNDKD